MEPQENKQLALHKALSSHEQAQAALADLMDGEADPRYTAMLERIARNIAELQSAVATTTPEDHV